MRRGGLGWVMRGEPRDERRGGADGYRLVRGAVRRRGGRRVLRGGVENRWHTNLQVTGRQ
jgi:hypothetical protein